MKQTQTEKVTLHSQGGDEMNVIYKKIKRIGIFIKHTGVYNHCVCVMMFIQSLVQISPPRSPSYAMIIKDVF